MSIAWVVGFAGWTAVCLAVGWTLGALNQSAEDQEDVHWRNVVRDMPTLEYTGAPTDPDFAGDHFGYDDDDDDEYEWWHDVEPASGAYLDSGMTVAVPGIGDETGKWVRFASGIRVSS